jgi:hypothetical protein
MRRLSRFALLAVSCAFLVSIGVLVGVLVTGQSSGRSAPTVIIKPPTSSPPPTTSPPPTNNDSALRRASEAYDRANFDLAAKLATPQTIANTFEFTQGMERLKG